MMRERRILFPIVICACITLLLYELSFSLPRNDLLSFPSESVSSSGTVTAFKQVEESDLKDLNSRSRKLTKISTPTQSEQSTLEITRPTATATAPTEPIPKIVHFIHGLKDTNVTFTFIHYLAIKSAYDVIKPDVIYFHCLNTDSDPNNEWWKRAQQLVQIQRVRNVTEIFGNPVVHFAHKADVLRLEILMKYGGIYLDIDVITLRSFDSLLQPPHVMVLGLEQISGAEYAHGLGNGVIITRPDSVFLHQWYDGYHQFDKTKWAAMSIQFPKALADRIPDEVTILGPKAFYTPCWDPIGGKMFYFRNDYDLSDNYAVHVWSSDKQRVTGPEDICPMTNLFGRILRIAYEGEGRDEKSGTYHCPPGSMHNRPVPFNDSLSAI